jgi:hypothetical protein
MSGGEFSFTRIVGFTPPILEKMSHTGEADIVERTYGAQNLLYARAEATYARQAVLLEIKCKRTMQREKCAFPNAP